MTRTPGSRRARLPILLLLSFAVGCSGDDTSAPIDGSVPGRSNGSEVITAPLAERLCAAQPAQAVGRIGDPNLTELSGLATTPVTPGVVWAHQDSGADPELFAIDIASGAAVGRVLVDAPNIDWEDLATDVDGSLLIADTGDNRLRRTEVEIIAVAPPAGLAAADGTTLAATRVAYRYPDGPHDVEAMFVDPTDGARYVITKAFNLDNLTIGADTVVYRLDPPVEPGGIGTATRVAQVRLGFAVATGADMATDGRTLAVRTYGSVLVWDRPEGTSIAEMFERQPCNAPASLDGQNEAIAFTEDGEGYVMAAEGLHPELWLVRSSR